MLLLVLPYFSLHKKKGKTFKILTSPWILEEKYTVSHLDSSFVLTSLAPGENATKNIKEEGREL